MIVPLGVMFGRYANQPSIIQHRYHLQALTDRLVVFFIYDLFAMYYVENIQKCESKYIYVPLLVRLV